MKTTLLRSAYLLLSFTLMFWACRPVETTVARYELPMAGPESQGMTASAFTALDSTFQDFVDSAKLTGVEAMVIRSGKIVYHKTEGWADVENKEMLAQDRIFRIASMTKPVTCVAALILMEEGHFELDDPISKFIPEFANPQVLETFNAEDTSYTTVPANREVSFRDLFTHTSGLGYAFINPEVRAIYTKNGLVDAFNLADDQLAEKMKVLAGLPLLHQPGEKWTYGLSIDMLGYAVEVISGQSLADFMKARIFDPLGMDDTQFYLSKEQENRLLKVYGIDEAGAIKPAAQADMTMRRWADAVLSEGTEAQKDSAAQALINFPKNGAKTYYSGGGGLTSTTENYARFALMLCNGGEFNGVRILSDSTVKLMSTNQYKEDRPYGLGVSISPSNPKATYPDKPGGFGWGGYFGTRYWADPAEDMVVLLMTQNNPNPHAGKMMDACTALIYGAIKRGETAPTAARG